MSARFIKVASGTVTQPFAPYAFDAPITTVTPLSNFAHLPIPAVIEIHDDPDVEAERIISDARAKAAEIERKALEDGRLQMQAEIESEVASAVEPWQAQLTSTLEDLRSLQATIATDAEHELARLAIEIARKIVHREVTLDQEVVMTLARIGLSRINDRTAASIHLNPEDFSYVNTHCQRLAGGHVLDLVEDRSISRGGCLIRTEMGDVDARIEQQFKEIERAFLES